VKTITIVCGLQLSDNPRVVKEAETLANAGYCVTVLCSLASEADVPRNLALIHGQRFHCHYVHDVRSKHISDRLRWNWRRFRRRAHQAMYDWFGKESGHQLGYHTYELLRICLRQNADLHSVHSPMALFVGSQLLAAGRCVSVDLEDWHSQDLRAKERSRLPITTLEDAERMVLKKAVFCSTTSHVLSNALRENYNTRPPIVLYNAFPLLERSHSEITSERREACFEITTASKLPRVGWVSQVIGPDRGLEQLVEATHHLRQPIEIHLTGRLRPGMAESLKSRLHSASEIVFQDQVPHEKLLALMQTYDIGFAGEIANNRNKDLTVSNKMLHYFLSGVPVVCSDTQGQMEIFAQVPDACRVYQQRDPVSLATAIDSLLVSDDVLQRAKRAAWDAGSTRFCWEAQEPKLLAAVREAIGPPQ
jgi:glycosyltransferase involved in cell wall biosynthesis